MLHVVMTTTPRGSWTSSTSGVPMTGLRGAANMALGIHEEGGVAAIMRSLDYVHFSTLYLANGFH